MNQNWNTYKLGEIGEFFGGVTSIKKEDYGFGTPFIPYKNVFKNSKIDISNLELMNVNSNDLKKRNAVYGDIFFTASSETPDEVAISSVLLDHVENLTYNGFCKRLRLHNFDTLLPEFARYYFKSHQFRTQVYQYKTGDVRFNISQESLSKIAITIPDIKDQKHIADVLTSLDDKIELNHQMNQTLESIAQAIFKEWFVDFNFPGFDGEFIDGLPKGWRMGTIDDVSTLIAGGDKPRDFSDYETETHNIPIYSNGISNDGLFGFTSNARIIVESVTVSARGTIGYPVLRQKPYFPIVRLLSVIPKVEVASAKYIFLWLKNSNIKGTGTTQQQLTAPDFKRFDVLIPEKSCVDNFTEIADNIYSKIFENKKQIEVIEQIRSSLIPKLMTGKIEI